jgi:four helix bundle protein
VCSQILRSGTAVAANYGEARGAESRADFVHKLKVVFKELNETTIWLEVIRQSSMLPPDMTGDIVAENRELCRNYCRFPTLQDPFSTNRIALLSRSDPVYKERPK